MSDPDIEDLHKAAVAHHSTTYIDPHTGYTVFTEYAHLQRGYCCGSKCRHCPYGWVNVQDGSRRPAYAISNDRESIKARLQEWETISAEAALAALQPNLSSSSNPNLQPEKSQKTGGRHGGRLTNKNVPYTRTGDKGTSQLLTGERRSKDDLVFEAMGTVDELCSVVGVAHAILLQQEQHSQQTTTALQQQHHILTEQEQKTISEITDWLVHIMSRLFDIGSHVAKPRRTPTDDSTSEEDDDDDKSITDTKATKPASLKTRFVPDGIGGGFALEHVQELEDYIDILTDQLPELTAFILPTGTVLSAQFHVARCVCRRAERRLVPLVQGGLCDPNAMQYLNRLSDFLFVAARFTNNIAKAEIQYKRAQRGDTQRVVVVRK